MATGYNSQMHRQAVHTKKYTLKERTAMKRDRIQAKEDERKAKEKPNPLRGILGFLESLKDRKMKVQGGQKNEKGRPRSEKGKRKPE